jgi:hypothetical protein
LQNSLAAASAQAKELESTLATAKAEIAALKNTLDTVTRDKRRLSAQLASGDGSSPAAVGTSSSATQAGHEARLRILGSNFGYHLENIGRGAARNVYIYAASSPYSRRVYGDGPRNWPVIAAGQKELLFRSAPTLGGSSEYTVEWDDDTASKRIEQVTANTGRGLF